MLIDKRNKLIKQNGGASNDAEIDTISQLISNTEAEENRNLIFKNFES